MITRTESLECFEAFQEYFGYEQAECVFFDIETTGFSARTSFLFLIGAVSCTDGAWRLHQWFADGLTEQPVILEAFFRFLAPYRSLVHFNGQTFDLPFLKEKAEDYHLAWVPGQMASLDLYQRFRPLKKLLGLARMNQGSLERYVGWQRTDPLTGKEMVSLYQKYAASREEALAEQMLLHNREDLVGMTKLLPLAAVCLLREGRFDSVDRAILENPADGSGSAPTDSSSVRSRISEQPAAQAFTMPGPKESARPFGAPSAPSAPALTLPLTLAAPLPAPLQAENAFASLCAEKKQGTLRIPCLSGELYHFFPDYRNYDFLPLENQAIHKSVASFVDESYRMPARPETCYVPKTGYFLWQPWELFTPSFRAGYREPELYFEYPRALSTGAEALRSYASAVLQALLK